MSLTPSKVVDGLLAAEGAVADFIANGPSTGFGGHVRDQYRKRCNQYANLPAWARALGGVPGGAMSRICEPYWEGNGWDGPVRNTPFIGGQCPIRYIIDLFNVPPGGPPGLAGQLFVTGPISAINVTQISAFTKRFQAIGAGGSSDQRDVSYLSGGDATFGNPTPRDGDPDNCGNPPSSLDPGANPPPDPGPTTGPEPTADPSNPSGPPLLPVEPYFDPTFGDIPVVGPDDGGGGTEPPGNPETSPGSPENVGSGIPGTETPEDGADTPFGDPPEGKVFIGALVKFVFPEELGNIPGSGPANRVVSRTVGNVSLIFEGGRGTAEQVRSEWVYLVRPTGALEVSGVHVNALPGTTYTVYPLSIETCPENLCGAQ